MHVLLIHQAFAALDEPGGTRHHELARYLVQRGHRVTIIASPVSYLTGRTRRSDATPAEHRWEEPGLTILRANTYTALHRSFFHRALSFISFMLSSLLVGMKVKDVDLVWGTSPPLLQGITAWILAWTKRAKFLFEVRDLWPLFAIAVGVLRQPVFIRITEWLECFLYAHADLLVVNSPGFIKHVRDRGARWVELVPNGSDTAMFDPSLDGRDFRLQHGLVGRYIVLYAGAHGMSNDLSVVLEAACLLKQQPSIVMVLLGDGKEKPALIQRVAELGLNNVRFIPPLPKAEMPAALAAADACIAILKPIDEYKTVYPNKVFDYMAAGKPVVLAIAGVIREVVEAAGAGIPVTPGDPQALVDAIIKLKENPQAGEEMGERGREYVMEHFDRVVLAQKLESLMLTLLGS